MFELKTLTVLLCVTAVLTSSVSKTDGSRNETYADVKNSHDAASVPSTSNEEIKAVKLPNDKKHSPIMGEGGPIYQNTQTADLSPIHRKTVPTVASAVEDIKKTSEELIPTDSKSKVPKIRNPSVVPRKGVASPSKISARKGVGLESLIADESTADDEDEAVSSVSSLEKTPKNTKIEPTAARVANNTKNSTIELKASPDALPAVQTNTSSVTHSKNSSASSSSESPTHVQPTVETKIKINGTTTTTTPSTTTKKFKPKPTVTIGEMDIDKPIPASPTKTPPLGMPRKIDYIVPVIITIMALPFLGGAAFFMYRRGRDCWDKRHYRRMDFLIDGMYNDHTSWK